MLEGREYGDADMRGGEAPVGDPRPQDRVHLRHVGAPQHERIRRLDVVIAAGGLVDAEGSHHAGNRGGHAVPRVRIDIVSAEAGLEQFRGGVALPDRPLPGAEHADAGWSALLQSGFEFLGHDIEGFIPRHGFELAVLVVFAVRLAQHRPGQAVVAVHDLGKEIALHAIEAAIDLKFDVAMGRHHAILLGRDHHAAAGAAEAAWGLVPFQFAGVALGDEIGRAGGRRHAGRCGRNCSSLQLQHLAAIEVRSGHDRFSRRRTVSRRRWRERQGMLRAHGRAATWS
jgi:hypothetical protein